MVALCEGSIRTYRINQISAIETTGVKASIPEGFDLASHWQTSIERLERDLHRHTADIRITAEGLRRLERWGAHVVSAAEASLGPPDEKGWMSATVPIESIEHATSELLALGNHALVVSPAELRHAVRAEARAMIALDQ